MRATFLTDKMTGKTVWINPDRVDMMSEHRDGGTVICFSEEGSVFVTESMQDIYARFEQIELAP